MKHTFRNVIVFLLRMSGATWVYRRIVRRHGPLVRVIAFHDVQDGVWFEAVIDMLSRTTHVLTPTAFRNGEYDPTQINTLITFDDGYASWVDVCLPVLERYGVHALFFINSGLLTVAGDSEKLSKYVHEHLRLSPKVPLTWDGARLLATRGHALGGHTVHHVSLATLPIDRVRTEVLDDKHAIEKEVGSTITDFAYPFGVARDFSEAAETCVRSCGYERVYIAEPGFLGTQHEHIPRTLIEKEQPIGLVHAWLFGGYDLFTRLKRYFSN